MIVTILLTASAFVVVFVAVCGYSQVNVLSLSLSPSPLPLPLSLFAHWLFMTYMRVTLVWLQVADVTGPLEISK